MLAELALRFLLGGAIVSAFAFLGELWEPKTFAGMFGAAPSVAIATLALAYATQGPAYVEIEAGSMLLGAVAFGVYAATCVATVKRSEMPVWLGAALAWGAWFVVALVARGALVGLGVMS